ncbi:HugZ family protein [Aureimonas sp. SK2]|uniref:HugZ family pyridoxamine 5'-phosphate oxidase n=1 Tax=Aureimonas sp. SK2 TaxID=3015992 RepID=UPI0024443746|nr:DUF2470 domain-containing protein [Aureimonas sp. SK2]
MTDQRPAAPPPYLAVDENARRLARRLARTARHAALAWLEPGTGAPMTSRIAASADIDGSPVLLLSRLSAHTNALLTDPRASLLVGEPGTGDPLAQPRLSIAGSVSAPINPDAPERERLARRFVSRHPPAAQYSAFADFAFFRMEVRSAFLNAGFAQAYPMKGDDIVDSFDAAIAAAETRVRDHMNEDHADVLVRLMAERGAPADDWRIATLDRRGFELIGGDRIERIEFAAPVKSASGFRDAFVALARSVEA